MDLRLLEAIRDDLTALREDVTDIKVTQGRHGVLLDSVRADLNHHMKRTDLLEKFQDRWAFVWTAFAALVALGAGIVKIAEFWR